MRCLWWEFSKTEREHGKNKEKTVQFGIYVPFVCDKFGRCVDRSQIKVMNEREKNEQYRTNIYLTRFGGWLVIVSETYVSKQ